MGSGASARRQTWLAGQQQPLTYTANFDILQFAWTRGVFRFTPQSNGLVTLTLMGPWEQSPAGALYRQEVLWDSLSATNALLPNGGFESQSSGLPAGWSLPYGDAGITNLTPLQGSNVLRTWHNGPAAVTMSVTGGVPVVLTLNARAVMPAGWPGMGRVGNHTPAHLAARRFMHGVNLGNCLEAPPNTWGTMAYTKEDFVNIKAQGFDHVRIPIGWHYYTGAAPGFVVSNSIFNRVDEMVAGALNEGLSVLINLHHFDAFTTRPLVESNRFCAIWRQVAEHYADYPPGLAFELLNEPKDAATTEVLAPIYAGVIEQIRASNPRRTLFVGPGRFNSLSEVANLRLPDDDANLIVTVHCYDPFLFTHQGASWTLPDTATAGLVYPGPPPVPVRPDQSVAGKAWITDWFQRYNTLPESENPCSTNAYASRFEMVKLWSAYYGRPVHLGEFGAFRAADGDSRARFYGDMRALAERCGFGWAVWDWKAGFYYWDSRANAPVPGLRKALFSPTVQHPVERE